MSASAEARIRAWPTGARSSERWGRSGPSSTGSVITFDPDALSARIAELEEAMGAPGFWDDQKRAAAISSEHARLTRRRERYDSLASEADDIGQLLELASDDGELDELEGALEALKAQLQRVEEDALFAGEYDAGDAVITIQAATGGTDAQDWAEMLLRMYLRWAADRGFATELIEASPGEEAGLKLRGVKGNHGPSRAGSRSPECALRRSASSQPWRVDGSECWTAVDWRPAQDYRLLTRWATVVDCPKIFARSGGAGEMLAHTWHQLRAAISHVRGTVPRDRAIRRRSGSASDRQPVGARRRGTS